MWIRTTPLRNFQESLTRLRAILRHNFDQIWPASLAKTLTISDACARPPVRRSAPLGSRQGRPISGAAVHHAHPRCTRDQGEIQTENATSVLQFAFGSCTAERVKNSAPTMIEQPAVQVYARMMT